MHTYIDFHRKANHDLKEVYSNITRQLGVKEFGHNRFYKNIENAYYFFCSNRDLVADYVLNIKTSKIIFSETIDKLKYNGREYSFISWPLIPESDAAKIFYRNGTWNGLTAVSFSENYTETWWVAFDCKGAYMTERFSTDEFRRAFLLSIDYFNKCLDIALRLPGSLILPRYKSSFEDKKDMIRQEDYRIIPSELMKAYYKTHTLFKINERVISLSKSETEVLSMIAKGFSSHEIAQARGTSVKTIENQLASIKYKTGLHLRSELFNLYHDQFGILLE